MNQFKKIIDSVLYLNEFPLKELIKSITSLIIDNIYACFHETWIVYLSFLCFALFYIIIMKVLDSRLSETARKNKKEMELSYMFQWDQPLTKTFAQVYHHFWPLLGFIGLLVSTIMNPAYCAGEVDAFMEAEELYKKRIDNYNSTAFEASNTRSQKEEIYIEGMDLLHEDCSSVKRSHLSFESKSYITRGTLMRLFSSTTSENIKDQIFNGWCKLEKASIEDYRQFSIAENTILNFWAHENTEAHENSASNEADVKYCEQLHGIRTNLLGNASVQVLQNKQLEVTNAYYKFIIEKQTMLDQIDQDQFFGENQTECYNDLLDRLEEAIERISLESASENAAARARNPDTAGNADSIVPGSDNEYHTSENEEHVVPDNNIDTSMGDVDTSSTDIYPQVRGSGSESEIGGGSDYDLGSDYDSGSDSDSDSERPRPYLQVDIEGPDRTWYSHLTSDEQGTLMGEPESYVPMASSSPVMTRSHVPSEPIQPIELTLGEIPNSKIWYKNIIEQIISDKESMVDGFMSILTELGFVVAPTELGVVVTELHAPLDMSVTSNAPLDTSVTSNAPLDMSLDQVEDISLRQTFAQLESLIAHDPAHAPAHAPAPFSQMEIENLMRLTENKAEKQADFDWLRSRIERDSSGPSDFNRERDSSDLNEERDSSGPSDLNEERDSSGPSDLNEERDSSGPKVL